MSKFFKTLLAVKRPPSHQISAVIAEATGAVG